MSLAFFQQIFEKISNIKFCEYPSSGNRAAPCWLADKETDKTNPIVTFRNFAYSPKKEDRKYSYLLQWQLIYLSISALYRQNFLKTIYQ